MVLTLQILTKEDELTMVLKSDLNLLNWTETEPVHSIAQATAEYSIEGEFNGILHSNYTIFYSEYNKEDIHKSTSTFIGYSFFESSDNKLVDSMFFEEKGIFAEGVTSGELKSKLANGNYFLEQGKMIITIEKRNS